MESPLSTLAVRKFFLEVPTSDKEGCSVKGSEKGLGSFVEVVSRKTGKSGESFWMHLWDRELLSREEQLSRCLVSCFGGSFEFVPLLSSLKRWAFESWLLKGDLRISGLGGALVLFEFKNKCEANMVLLRGCRRFEDREFILQRWGPEVGCTWNESHAKEGWVRVVGLPLHLWSREVFKRIGECCGGYVVVDKETTFFSQLQWARILVKVLGKN